MSRLTCEPTSLLAEAIHALMPRARADLAELVALRSVADATPATARDCERAAAWVARALAAEGLDVRLLDADDGSTTVYGHLPGPPGAPRVVLYAHYDVVPELDRSAWLTPPFELTERDGRWYGRGAADCKGNILMHLTALRALRAWRPAGSPPPVDVTVLVEGSEEQGRGSLERLLVRNPGLLAPDAVLVGDTGNFTSGRPTLTTTLRGMAVAEITVSTLTGELHSGQFGGAAPDALSALIRLLASLHDDQGNTTITDLAPAPGWNAAVSYPEADFRRDAGLLDGVDLIGNGPVADRLWSRPAATVLAIEAPALAGAAPTLLPSVKALVSLRLPPGTDPEQAHRLLAAHLHRHVPWGARLDIEPVTSGSSFRSDATGPAHTAMRTAMAEAYGIEPLTMGAGGSISVCTTFQDLYPDAEILLLGVEDPKARIHAPNESVDPGEIAAMAHAEALFLQNYTTSPATTAAAAHRGERGNR